MSLTRKQYRESLDQILTNLIELKSDYTTQKTLVENDCKNIEDPVITNDEDIPDLFYPTDIKSL